MATFGFVKRAASRQNIGLLRAPIMAPPSSWLLSAY